MVIRNRLGDRLEGQSDLFNGEKPAEIRSWSDLKWWGSPAEKNVWKQLEGRQYCPAKEHVYNALTLTQWSDVKVVILGQDPYPNPGNAHGLAFSVRPGVPLPASLQNIFSELHADIGCPIPESGSLYKWAEQGVLLLNTVLTVEVGEPNSHRGFGWEHFTSEIIRSLLLQREDIVFILWGKDALGTFRNISMSMRQSTLAKHLQIVSSHPSPRAAHHGFFGSRPFSRANMYLGDRAIDWCLGD